MPVRDVRDALPRVKEVSFDRVARQIPDRMVSLRLDRPLDTLSDRTRLDARVHGLNRGLQGKFGGSRERGPVPRADLDRDRGIRDPAVHLRPEVQLHDVAAVEPQGVVVGRRVVRRDIVDREARREGGTQAPPSHQILDFLGELA